MNLFQKLLHDEHGFIITTELVIIATLLVIGLITGIQCLQAAVVAELKDVGDAIGSLNQSYSYSGMRGCWSWGRNGAHSNYTRGSAFFDTVDEYRENVEIGCLDYGYGATIQSGSRIIEDGTLIESHGGRVLESRSGATIQQHSIETGPCPSADGLPCPDRACPPGSTIIEDGPGPTLAPQDCPPEQDCPDAEAAH